MKKRVIPILLIGTGGLLLLGTALLIGYQNMLNNPREAPFPSSLGDFPVFDVISGKMAVTSFTEMHSQAFPLSSGTVAYYGSQRQITLWVSAAPVPCMAARMTKEMAEKIASVSTPFTPAGDFEQAGVHVFGLDGLGQRHYYFQAGRYLIWVAANHGIAEAVLGDTIAFYH